MVPTLFITDDHLDGLGPYDLKEISYEKKLEGQPTGLGNQEKTIMNLFGPTVMVRRKQIIFR